MGRCRNWKGKCMGRCRNWKGCGWALSQTRGQPHPVYLPTVISVFRIFCLSLYLYLYLQVVVFICIFISILWVGCIIGELVLVFSICVCICICVLLVGGKEDKESPAQSIYLPSLVSCFKPKGLFRSQNSIFEMKHCLQGFEKHWSNISNYEFVNNFVEFDQKWIRSKCK